MVTTIDLTRAAQRRLGRTLRSRVAGDDAPTRAARIWGATGPRWFTPDDPVWRVHADAAMFPGGIASLLLQSLHPLAMAGVAGHSGYRGDPWGRLQRTSSYLAVTTFGTIADARVAIDHVASIHERVRGRDERGRPYRAGDPHLLTWVHAAEISSFLAAYQAFAADPLSPAEADCYVAQAGVPAALLGVPSPPQTVADLDTVVAAYRSELELTDAARDASRFLLLDPPVPLLARAGYGMLATAGVSVLPPWARRMLRLPMPALAETVVARPIGRLATRTVRWGIAGLEERRPSDAPET